jgi:ATP-dependent RNA helicase RhlE
MPVINSIFASWQTVFFSFKRNLMTSFSSLGLSDTLVQAAAEQNYTQPYPIQLAAIPAILKGKDVFGIAQTGSGKTAGFVLPLLELLQNRAASRSRHVKVLVLVPTRELAMQVGEVFRVFNARQSQPLKTLAVYGGVSINPQMIALRGTEILVATPGRLLDLVSSRAVHLSEVETLVLDEADKMLNQGFREEMEQIFQLLPRRRQNILFSATLGDDIEAIRTALLLDPVVIDIEPASGNLDLITQTAYLVTPERKGPFLRYLIRQQHMQQVLVFVSSTRGADNLVAKLVKNGLEAMALHGDKSQGARTEALNKFKKGHLRVLVATDLVSRGIDIQFLPHVINFDLPRSPKDYIHRIGRTGRAESPGEAITLVGPEDEHHFRVIQKKMGKTVPVIATDEVDLKGV